MKTWSLAITIITGLSLIVGTTFAIDNHFAKQSDHVALAQAFEQYLLEEKYDRTQERIWELETRRDKAQSEETKEELTDQIKKLEVQKERLEKKIMLQEVPK